MKLYIVRHGETDWNKKRLIQGQTDIPLNDNGVFVAQLTADAYKKEGLTFSKVYSSPLKRAYKTAEILVKENTAANTEIIVDHRLLEFDFGKLEGESLTKVDPNKPDGSVLYQCFYECETYEPTLGGESYYDMIDRSRDFLENEIMTKNWEKDENVLVVCHGGVIRGLLCVLLNKPVKDFWDTSHKNLSTSIFEYDSDTKTFTAEAVAKYYYDTDAHAINAYR